MRLNPDIEPQGYPYDLFGGLPPHVHQETSREAAESIRIGAESLALKALNYIQSQGSVGATCWDVEDHCNMRHQTASARIRGLVQQGLICNSGRTRETESGRKAIVWLATFK
jgi:hypothetical protein